MYSAAARPRRQGPGGAQNKRHAYSKDGHSRKLGEARLRGKTVACSASETSALSSTLNSICSPRQQPRRGSEESAWQPEGRTSARQKATGRRGRSADIDIPNEAMALSPMPLPSKQSVTRDLLLAREDEVRSDPKKLHIATTPSSPSLLSSK